MRKMVIHPSIKASSTEVYVGHNLLNGPELLECCRQVKGKIVLVADRSIKDVYADPLAKKLSAEILSVPSGEKTKTLGMVTHLIEELLNRGCARDTLLVAMGGGVTTDLVGFVASIYMRGIPLILIPTTLLAIVDASIGGKTAIDTPQGKNLMGTLYYPKAIFSDLDTLSTLPEKERFNGLAEILKMGLIYDSSIWDLAKTHTKDPELILKAIQGKITVIEQDPREVGLRRILNFGHTIGHGLETMAHYEMPHGEAVALGSLVEARLSRNLGYLSEKEFEQIEAIYRPFPLQLPKGYVRSQLIHAMAHDKKKALGETRFVLIDKIGHCIPFEGAYCRAVSPEELESTLCWMENVYASRDSNFAQPIGPFLSRERYMDPLEINPLKKPTTATISIPGSKSYTNRALIMAALTKGTVCLKNPLYSEDTEAMIECLRTLGIQIEIQEDQIFVHGDIHSIEHKYYELFAHDSGTTVRFMLALLCIVPGIKKIQGSKRLNERPIRDLVEALKELGALITYLGKEGELPVEISSSTLSETSVHLKGDTSSQFCSALLLISPYLSSPFTIHIIGSPISKPYIDMTLSCMQDWGVKVVSEAEGSYVVPGGQSYQKKEYVIEGDFSSAGYFFAIAALTKSTLTLQNLNPSSAQADRKFLEILAGMGNQVSYGENQISIQGKQLLPIDVDMEDCPDQVMTLAVLAAFAKGVTKISGVRSLRVKETERVLALKNELGKMGIRTEDTHDTLTIYGGSPHAAEIDTYNDHRMAMAFAVAGTHLPGMIIRHPEVVNKTFPTFWKVLGRLNLP